LSIIDSEDLSLSSGRPWISELVDEVFAFSFETLKKAIVYGTVVASFAIADFSLRGLTSIERSDIDGRFEALRKLTAF